MASFATTPLILVLIRFRREQQRRELYLVHVVGPSVREALRKVEGKVVTGQAGTSEPHASSPNPARLVCRFGSATTADYDEYLAEKKIEDFWKPEVEVDSKFLPKSPKRWQEYFGEILKEMGFEAHPHDACVLHQGGRGHDGHDAFPC